MSSNDLKVQHHTIDTEDVKGELWWIGPDGGRPTDVVFFTEEAARQALHEMTEPSSDDLTQQLADVMMRGWYGKDVPPSVYIAWRKMARAILASGLVVPASAVNDLADLWVNRPWPRPLNYWETWPAELRALTQQDKK